MRRLTWVSLAGCALAIGVACSSNSGTTTTASGNVGSATTSVDADGATVEAGAASVEIPEDALTDSEEIGIEEADVDVDPPEGLSLAGPAVAFTPHGQTFEEPVTLTLPYESSSDDLVVLRLDDEEDTTWEQVEGGSFRNGEATVEVTSFSIYAVAEEESSGGEGGSGGDEATGGASAEGGESAGGSGAQGGDSGEGGSSNQSSGDATLDAICAARCEAIVTLGCPEDPEDEDACVSDCEGMADGTPEACYGVILTYNECTRDKDFLVCDDEGTAGVPDEIGDPDDPNDCGQELVEMVGCLQNGAPSTGENAPEGEVYGSCVTAPEGEKEVCIDYTGAAFESIVSMQCSDEEEQTLSEEPCDADGAIAVCATDEGGENEHTAYYFGGPFENLEVAQQHCEGALRGEFEEL